MKDEKKVTKAEEEKEEVKTEEKGTPLTDEEMAQINAAGLSPIPIPLPPSIVK